MDRATWAIWEAIRTHSLKVVIYDLAPPFAAIFFTWSEVLPYICMRDDPSCWRKEASQWEEVDLLGCNVRNLLRKLYVISLKRNLFALL